MVPLSMPPDLALAARRCRRSRHFMYVASAANLVVLLMLGMSWPWFLLPLASIGLGIPVAVQSRRIDRTIVRDWTERL